MDSLLKRLKYKNPEAFEDHIDSTRRKSISKNKHPLFVIIEEYEQTTPILQDLNTNIINLHDEISKLKKRKFQLIAAGKVIVDDKDFQENLTPIIKMHETSTFHGIVLYSLIRHDIDYRDFYANTTYRFGYDRFFDRYKSGYQFFSRFTDQTHALEYADKHANELYKLYKKLKSHKIKYKKIDPSLRRTCVDEYVKYSISATLDIITKELQQNIEYCKELELQKHKNEIKSIIAFLISKTTKDWFVVAIILSYL